MPSKDDLRKHTNTTQLPTNTSAQGSQWLKTEPSIRTKSGSGHNNFFKRGIVALVNQKAKRQTGKLFFFKLMQDYAVFNDQLDPKQSQYKIMMDK
jgi:hypothetical protein